MWKTLLISHSNLLHGVDKCPFHFQSVSGMECDTPEWIKTDGNWSPSWFGTIFRKKYDLSHQHSSAFLFMLFQKVTWNFFFKRLFRGQNGAKSQKEGHFLSSVLKVFSIKVALFFRFGHFFPVKLAFELTSKSRLPRCILNLAGDFSLLFVFLPP